MTVRTPAPVTSTAASTATDAVSATSLLPTFVTTLLRFASFGSYAADLNPPEPPCLVPLAPMRGPPPRGPSMTGGRPLDTPTAVGL